MARFYTPSKGGPGTDKLALSFPEISQAWFLSQAAAYFVLAFAADLGPKKRAANRARFLAYCERLLTVLSADELVERITAASLKKGTAVARQRGEAEALIRALEAAANAVNQEHA